MVSSAENVALSITKWCFPCSSPYFPNSYDIYQHQYLGLHLYQMVEPASYPAIDLTMVKFWLPRYVGEQANCAQTRASSSITP